MDTERFEIDDDFSLPGEKRGSLSLAERVDEAFLRLDSWRDRPGVTAIAVASVAVVLVAGWWFGRSAPTEPVEDRIPIVQLETTEPAPQPPERVVVHVAGAVSGPGVFTFDAGDRVLDAIEAAGGAMADADLDQLNLAAPLVDGMQVRVPVEGEILPAELLGSPAGPVDINRASGAQLEELPGVGPATAQAIVAWRDKHGPFASTEGLLDVPGIGPAKLAALADLIVAG
ncbi:MAG: competence protein ComEA [Acidimicrobiales bacterium]|jgi:competence protein ComEA